jgi:signal transduction histidine kinase
VSAVDVRLAGRGRKALHFAPAGFLGAERWEAYAQAVRALRRVQNPIGCATTCVERAASAVAQLQAAGFVVRAAADALGKLREGDATLRARAEGAAAGVDLARDRLAERGAAFKGQYQATGVGFANGRRSALLLDDMGTGKTLQSLAGLPPDARVVVACPASVVGAWVAEVARWTNLKPRELASAADFTWPEPGEVLVVTHDRVPPCKRVVCEHLADFRDAAMRWLAAREAGWLLPEMPRLRRALPPPPAPPGARVVLDEVHAFKASTSARTRNARALVKQALDAGGSALGLTGTPIQNDLRELKTVLDVLDLFGEAFGSWRKFNEATPDDVAAALARVAIRRTKAEVAADLPPKTVDVVWVPLADQAAEAAERMRALVLERIAAAEADAGRPLTADEHEAALVAAIESQSEVGAMSSARKVIALAVLASPEVQGELDRLAAAGEPVVVACPSAEPVAILGARARWARIAGDVPARERTRAIADFQAGSLDGIALGIRAGGTGVTLTAARRMLFVGRDWNPAINLQTEDRIHRHGQTRPCRITYYVADCWVERHVVELCAQKSALTRESLAPLVGRAPAPVALPDLQKVSTLAPQVDKDRTPRHAPQAPPSKLAPPPAPVGWLPLDDALRARLVRLAGRGDRLAAWLLSRFVDAIPPEVGTRERARRSTLDLLAEAEARL